MKRRKCFYLKRLSYYIRDYIKKKKDSREKLDDDVVVFDESSDGAYHSANLLIASIEKIIDQWALDFIYSFYMSHGRVLMGNHNAREIFGIGSIKIRMYNGTTITLKHVRHVPKLKKKMNSLGILDSSATSINQTMMV